MIFCKFDKSISIFPYEKAVGHRLIVAPALKELTNMAAMLDFVLRPSWIFGIEKSTDIISDDLDELSLSSNMSRDT